MDWNASWEVGIFTADKKFPSLRNINFYYCVNDSSPYVSHTLCL